MAKEKQGSKKVKGGTDTGTAAAQDTAAPPPDNIEEGIPEIGTGAAVDSDIAAVVGVPGCPFNIRGSGFGDHPGALIVDGQEAPITVWTPTLIKGSLPAGVTGDSIVLVLHTGETLRGRLA